MTSEAEPEVSPAIEGRAARLVLHPLLKRISRGQLHLVLPDNSRMTVGTGPPEATVELRNWRAIRRLLLAGELGLARAYLDGDWHTPDLLAFFQLALANMDGLRDAKAGSWPARLAGLAHHWTRRNTRRGSRRNIAAHYDLGNDFYAEWLDPSMTYSAAWYADGANSLESAQHAKYRRICERLRLVPGDRVLEIGCGWGGFAEVATKEYGATVEGVTLSCEQLAFARARARRGGFDDRATFHLTDYRDTQGQYDKVVSIEMFEAVGERNWPTFFQTVRDRLKPGGAAMVQSITIDDHLFDPYRRRQDFIQHYIFPGGMLPSPERFGAAASGAGLETGEASFFGAAYARTLLEWRHRFVEAWDRIAEMPGFDIRFRRMWEFYLLYCAAGFQAGAIDVAQFRLTRPA